MLLLLHKTLKGSRNIQGFALIRAVLFSILHLAVLFKHFNRKFLLGEEKTAKTSRKILKIWISSLL